MKADIAIDLYRQRLLKEFDVEQAQAELEAMLASLDPEEFDYYAQVTLSIDEAADEAMQAGMHCKPSTARQYFRKAVNRPGKVYS